MHWTFYLTIGYGMAAILLFFVRVLLQWRNWKGRENPHYKGSGIDFRVRARIGVVPIVLLIIALVLLYVGGVILMGGLLGKIFDILGVVLLTVGILRMRIWPWSLSEIGVSSNAGIPPMFWSAMNLPVSLTNWWKTPMVGIGDNCVTIAGSTGGGSRSYTGLGEKTIVIWKEDLGTKEFEIFRVYMDAWRKGIDFWQVHNLLNSGSERWRV
jgi:uncharacterized membrane protein YphA (DoxX/SURF4 family)